MRAPLSETLATLVAGVLAPPGSGLRVDEIHVDTPIEVSVGSGPDGPVLLASPPRWRWRTDFDTRPGRMRVHLVMEHER